MVEKVNVAGQEIPVFCGYRVIREWMSSPEVDASEMMQGSFDMSKIESLLVLAINAGYQKEKIQKKITQEQLIDLLDEDLAGFGRLQAIVTNAMEQLEPDAAKKGNGKRRK